MQVDEVNKIDKIREENKQNSNESSSDTDKTSGSLFNSNAAGIELSRIKELPSSFYKGYVSLDEFLSTTSTSDNANRCEKVKGGKPETHQKRTHLQHQKRTHTHHHHHHARSSTATKQIIPCITTSASSGSLSSNVFKPVTKSSAPKIVTLNAKSRNGGKQGAQDAIDEMNRQYDHNLCLDRFMNDIEQNQKEHQQENDVGASRAEQGRSGCACNISPANSSLSSCSSLLPQSIEDTESGSRNSESIKSSTPENVNNDKDSSGNSSSNGSSKDDKLENNSKDIRKKTSKTTANHGSEDSTSSTSVPREQFSSIESGIVADSSSPNETNHNMDFESNEGNSCNNEKTNNYKGGKLGRKRKRGYIYNPKPVIEKPPKQFVPEQAKDQSYWDKRQRNNEAARRSREMRRVKEKETHDKLVRLKTENEALRVAITLLIQKNENLEIIIDEFEKTGNSSSHPENTTVPVTC